MIPCDDLPLEQPVCKQKREAFSWQENPRSMVSKDSDNEEGELIFYVEPTTQLPEISNESEKETCIEPNMQLPEASVETDKDIDDIGPNEPAISSTEDLDSSLASTEAPSSPPRHPQRVRRQVEALQYMKFGQPSSFLVCNIVQVPQRLAYVYYPPQFQQRLSHIMPVPVPFVY